MSHNHVSVANYTETEDIPYIDASQESINMLPILKNPKTEPTAETALVDMKPVLNGPHRGGTIEEAIAETCVDQDAADETSVLLRGQCKICFPSVVDNRKEAKTNWEERLAKWIRDFVNGSSQEWSCLECMTSGEERIHCWHTCPALPKSKYNACQHCIENYASPPGWRCKLCVTDPYHCLHNCPEYDSKKYKYEFCAECEGKMCGPAWECAFCDDNDEKFHCPAKCDMLSEKFGAFQIVLLVLGMAIGFYDIVSDVLLAETYFEENHNIWGALTLLLTAAPVFDTMLSVSANAFSYITDKNKSRSVVIILVGILSLFSVMLWPVHVLYLPLLMILVIIQRILLYRKYSNVVQSFESAREKYSCSNAQQIMKEIYVLEKLFDRSMLLHALLESAPELLLQMYIIISHPPSRIDSLSIRQIASIAISFLTLSYNGVNLQMYTYINSYFWKAMYLGEKILLSLWQMFTAGVRVIILALTASSNGWLFLTSCALHYVIMISYYASILKINRNHGPFSRIRILQNILALLSSLITFHPSLYLYEYTEGFTEPFTVHFTFYYILTCVENVILMCIWYSCGHDTVHEMFYSCDHPHVMRKVAMFLVLGYLGGIIFFVIYSYKSGHRTAQNPLKRISRSPRILNEHELNELQRSRKLFYYEKFDKVYSCCIK